MKKILLIILTILSFQSCNLATSKRIDDSSDSISKTTQVQALENTKDILTSTKWVNSFSDHKLGYLNCGDNVKNSLRKLSLDFAIEYDSIESCIGCEDEFDYYYNVLNDENKIVFTLHPGNEKNNSELILMFKLYDSEYISDKGISIGNSVKELNEKYIISETLFDYENGMFLFVKDFHGSFRLDYNSYSNNIKIDFKNPKLETIPENSTIDMIVIL